MTFNPRGDIRNRIRFVAEYEDGLLGLFAVPECGLNQGPMPIARIVAREWQDGGYLPLGRIVSVRRLTTEEFMSDVIVSATCRLPPSLFSVSCCFKKRAPAARGRALSGGWLP